MLLEVLDKLGNPGKQGNSGPHLVLEFVSLFDISFNGDGHVWEEGEQVFGRLQFSWIDSTLAGDFAIG